MSAAWCATRSPGDPVGAVREAATWGLLAVAVAYLASVVVGSLMPTLTDRPAVYLRLLALAPVLLAMFVATGFYGVRTGRAPRLEQALRFFARFRDDRRLRLLIIAVNLVGIAYGFWYYREQLAKTPVAYWLLVPDSPLALVWATAALVLADRGRRSAAMEGLAIVGNIHIGVWTAFVLLFYERVTWPRLDWFLFWLHLAMAAQALIFVDSLRRSDGRARGLALAAGGGFYGLNTWADYWYTGFGLEGCVGLHPVSIHPLWEPCAGLGTVATATLAIAALTLILAGGLMFARAASPSTG